MIANAIEAILQDHCTPQAVRAIERGAGTCDLWARVADAGFFELMSPASEAQAEVPPHDVYGVFVQLGRHAAPLPLGPSLAARALVAEPAALPPGMMITLASRLERIDGMLRCPSVPYGSMAEAVLVADGDRLRLLPRSGAQRLPQTEGQDGGDGSDGTSPVTLVWPDEASPTSLAGDATALPWFAASTYAAMLCGAMQRAFELTLDHCNTRRQFDRHLGKFQAVQHTLSVMAEHLAAAGVAAAAAFHGLRGRPDAVAAAVAKARASEAAALVAQSAHALHGAIGITEDHDLQLFTRRLHAWRHAHGAESHWHRQLGRLVLASDAPLSRFIQDR